MKKNEMETNYSKEKTPIPICIVSENGKILWANEEIKQVFLYGDIVEADIFALTGIYYTDFISKNKNGEIIERKLSDKIFKILVEEKENDSIQLYFIDITKEKTKEEELFKKQLCVLMIHVDNYDEIVGNSDSGVKIERQIDKVIRNFGRKLKAIVSRNKVNLYVFTLERQYLEEEREEDFPILEEIRNIETEEDFPVTLSIGIGIGAGTLPEMENFSDIAIDLALGRGGDQVVIKEGDAISYYGGQRENISSRNKGKSRIIALALKALIENASNVIIMGHKYPDMDSFGAALGVHRLSRPLKKETYILLDNPSESLNIFYKKAKETEEYKFITKEKAMAIAKKKTLLIVVDVNRPSIVECPELLEKVGRIVVIDHHRKGEESIASPTIAYTEPAASSASELVAEMLEYGTEEITKLEAEALLGGIFIDTNRFSVKTGVRTLSAAGWLKENGADTTAVKRYFQMPYEMFMNKAAGVSGARVISEEIAISICEGFIRDAQVINSQVADELLTIEGVKASFVASKDEKGETMVSARSLGDINVQAIMEVFNGGGHLTTAGTQTNQNPNEIIEKIVEYLKEKEIIKE